MLSQLVPLLCYILFTALVIVYRKKLARREVMFFLLYIFVPLGGQAIQLNYLVVDDEPLVPQDLEDILKKVRPAFRTFFKNPETISRSTRRHLTAITTDLYREI